MSSPCGTILVYLGNYLVYLYLVTLLTKVVSSEPCGVKSALVRRFPEGDKAHSPMASDFRSGALGVVGSSEPCGMMLVYLGNLNCPPKLGISVPR